MACGCPEVNQEAWRGEAEARERREVESQAEPGEGKQEWLGVWKDMDKVIDSSWEDWGDKEDVSSLTPC